MTVAYYRVQWRYSEGHPWSTCGSDVDFSNALDARAHYTKTLEEAQRRRRDGGHIHDYRLVERRLGPRPPGYEEIEIAHYITPPQKVLPLPPEKRRTAWEHLDQDDE